MKRHFVIVMEAIETWLADSDGNLRPPDIPRTYEIDCPHHKNLWISWMSGEVGT